jgi:Concanavalin A-like lectin/glucanases superfamily
MNDPLSRHRPLIGLMVVLVLIGSGLTMRGSAGAFTAKITNSSDTIATIATAAYFTCAGAQVGASGTGALFAYPFGESSGNVATDISGNGNNGTYHTPGALTFGVANSTVCPRDHTTVMTFNGVSGYVTGPSDSDPQVFSEEIWFKTSASGYLMGFGGNPTGQNTALTGYDRQLYVSANGYLVFDVYSGAYQHIASTTTYNDNAWHHAVATLSSAGMNLYADGALVASDPSITRARCYLAGGCIGLGNSGYWRIGWDNLTGYYDVPASFRFAGSLAYAAVYSYALTASQVKDHYIAGTL